MMNPRQLSRFKRKQRNALKGTTDRPRLSIFRSSANIYAQVIDDSVGKTICSVHSFVETKRAGVEMCKALGIKAAELCKANKVSKLVFDRNGYAYHGRVKAFAEGLREGGMDV